MKDGDGCDVGKWVDKKKKKKLRKKRGKRCLSAGGVALAPEQDSQGQNQSVTACHQGTTETSSYPVSFSLVHLFSSFFSSLEAIKRLILFSLNLRTLGALDAKFVKSTCFVRNGSQVGKGRGITSRLDFLNTLSPLTDCLEQLC